VPRLLASPQRKLKLEEGRKQQVQWGDDQNFDLARSFFDSSLATARQKMTSWSLIKEMKRLPYTRRQIDQIQRKKIRAVLMLIWLYHFEAWYKEAGKSIVPWMGFAGHKLELLRVYCQKPEETASLNDSLSPGSDDGR
jgi:hypothetical protein